MSGCALPLLLFPAVFLLCLLSQYKRRVQINSLWSQENTRIREMKKKLRKVSILWCGVCVCVRGRVAGDRSFPVLATSFWLCQASTTAMCRSGGQVRSCQVTISVTCRPVELLQLNRYARVVIFEKRRRPSCRYLHDVFYCISTMCLCLAASRV